MRLLIISLLFFFIMTSCSMRSFVVSQMTPVFKTSIDAFYEETDLKIAEQALASNLKLLEGFLKNDPENEELLLLLAQGYAGYALGFVEDEDPKRAKIFYQRAFNFGQRALFDPSRQTWQWTEESKKVFEDKLKSLEESEIPALFWTVFAMAGKINVSLDDPSALINISVLENAIETIKKLDPGFFYGSVFLLKGSIEGMKPRMLGGNPEAARENFEKNLEITNGQFLLTQVYQAKFYAAKTLNEELFDQLIKEVEEFDIGTKPEIALFNQIARKKAALLKSRRDELF
jgi:hypothetical protein